MAQPGATLGQVVSTASATPATGATPETQTTPQATPEETPTFETWLPKQDAPVKAMLEQRFQALETSIKTVRQERRDMERQLTEAMKTVEAGSAAAKALESIQAQLAGTQAQAAFYEEALRPEVNLEPSMIKLAFLAAQKDNLIDGHGRIHWDELKQAYPGLFKRPQVAPGNAGVGTASPPVTVEDMNTRIRRMAGRQ
jgi:hypothetical protein